MEGESKLEVATLKCKNVALAWSSQIFINWRSKKAFLCLMSVFLNFQTNFNVRSLYLFFKASAVESLDGNLSLVRKINTNDITKILMAYFIENDLLR